MSEMQTEIPIPTVQSLSERRSELQGQERDLETQLDIVRKNISKLEGAIEMAQIFDMAQQQAQAAQKDDSDQVDPTPGDGTVGDHEVPIDGSDGDGEGVEG